MLLFMAIIQNEEWITISAKYMYDEESFQMLLKLEEEDELYHYMGLLSLALTVVNVIMVAVGAAGMFRLKEVLPVKKTVFWDDLKIARRIYMVEHWMRSREVWSVQRQLTAGNTCSWN